MRNALSEQAPGYIVVAGHLSDRVGRKNMFMIGCVFMGIFGFIYFAMLDTRQPVVVFIATWLFATYGSTLPIAIYIALCAVIGIVATTLLTDYTNKSISEEYAGV